MTIKQNNQAQFIFNQVKSAFKIEFCMAKKFYDFVTAEPKSVSHHWSCFDSSTFFDQNKKYHQDTVHLLNMTTIFIKNIAKFR